MFKAAFVALFSLLAFSQATEAQLPEGWKLYSFSYQSKLPKRLKDKSLDHLSVICDQPVGLSLEVPGVRCLIVSLKKHITISDIKVVETTGNPRQPLKLHAHFEPANSFEGKDVALFSQVASVNEPLLFVVNLYRGQARYGFNLNQTKVIFP